MTWRYPKTSNRKELKQEFAKDCHDELRKELVEKMTEELWDGLVGEIKK